MFHIGLIGCGVIGERRVLNLPTDAKVVACYDVDVKRAQVIAGKTQSQVSSTLEDFFSQKSVVKYLNYIKNGHPFPVSYERIYNSGKISYIYTLLH